MGEDLRVGGGGEKNEVSGLAVRLTRNFSHECLVLTDIVLARGGRVSEFVVGIEEGEGALLPFDDFLIAEEAAEFHSCRFR